MSRVKLVKHDVSKPSAPASKSRAGGKVTVACKMPAGMILQLFRMEDRQEPVMGGGWRTVQFAVKHGEAIRVNGPSVPWGLIPRYRIVGGYALTEGIDEEFFEEWMKQNEKSDAVKNKIIFGWNDPAYAADNAKENRTVKSGLEPLDVEMITRNGRQMLKDDRIPKSPLPQQVADITKADPKQLQQEGTY